jgi:glycosyltransferase involved in cell wall biosynthesis
MSSNKLSIIIPFVNEHPQVAFTIQVVLEELKNSDINFEIIAVNNYTKEVDNQKLREELCPFCMHPVEVFRTEDKGGEFLNDKVKHNSQLKYIKYDKKLSHWNAKNEGVKNSIGNILLFLDAHVIPSQGSIKTMFNYYIKHYETLNGTLHLPLAYLLSKSGQELIYKIETDPNRGFYHYTFSSYRKEAQPYKVPCMSTCGMMMSRELYDLLGGWPTELGIYGGGENFINYTLAVLGKNKWIMTTGPLYHYADSRGYFYNYDDFVRNRTIATYMFAGEEVAHLFARHCQGNMDILEKIYQDAITKTTIHRKLIEDAQQLSIDEWLAKMKLEGMWDGNISKREWVS